MMEYEFSRAERLLGERAIRRLKDSHVMVFGIGGVGSHCIEALARGGVGRLTLIDSDRVSISNINRQSIACHSTIGRYKTVSAKRALAKLAERRGTPIISCMGTGNKLDPSAFEIADIYETSVCPLCRVMRRELRRRGVERLTVLYSREKPMTPGAGNGASAEAGETDESAGRPVPGSVSFVPPAAGLRLAGYVLMQLLEGEGNGNEIL